MAKEFRINSRIKAREVRLIGEEGEQLGLVSLLEALAIARERSVDLVEVAPTAEPPVCRLMDYGKFKYAQAKKEREARKNQKVVLVREVRLRPKIDEHDIDFKTKQIHRFLTGGDKVKLSVMFRGREMTHVHLGKELLDKVLDDLKDLATVEKPAAMEGRFLTVILSPAPTKGKEVPRVKEV
ncbi:MAG: translation initiation factor IF-3 [Chloroflexi bacterium]|nr:translation initiation factor IF-3 [Chloroflexota bacterium]